MSVITVWIVGCGVVAATAGPADWAEAQAQVPDLRGCTGPVATRYLKLRKVPFDVVGDASPVVLGQDGDASHVTLRFDPGVYDDVAPPLPECSVVAVPDVVGLELGEAIDLIVKSGLTGKGDGTGTVAEQDPRGRSVVERGTTVSLVVGTGEPASEQPGGVAGGDAGSGAGEAEHPAGDAPAAGSEATAGDDPARGDAPAGEAEGGDQPAGVEPSDAGEPGGDPSPGSGTSQPPTAALLGAIGVTLAAGLALLIRARPRRRRRNAVGRAGNEPRHPQVPARVRLVPHDVAHVVAGPDGGPPVSVTASLDEADLAVRMEEGV